MEPFESEHQRLNRRISLITGTDLARELRQYRATINKRPEIDKRHVRAFPYQTSKGVRYRAADDIPLCHRFLDMHGVEALLS